MLFVLGFNCMSSIYEISKTSKAYKSEKVEDCREVDWQEVVRI